MNALFGLLLVIGYVGVLFVVGEFLGFNKADDEH